MVNPVIVIDQDVMNGTPCFRPTVTREMAVQALEEAKESLLARIE